MTLVTTQIDGPLATITIDSPPLNLFEAQMIGELSQAIENSDLDRLCGKRHCVIGRRTEHTVGQIAKKQRAAGHG